jgi:hypothetical protein
MNLTKEPLLLIMTAAYKADKPLFVIPDLIRNPVILKLVPGLRRDDVWIPTFETVS